MADEDDKRATQPPASSTDAAAPPSSRAATNKSGSFLKAKVERLSNPDLDDEEETRIEKHPQRRRA